MNMKKDICTAKYELTEKGKKECEIYIAELKAKRKEILDAGLDTADETFVDYTPEVSKSIDISHFC